MGLDLQRLMKQMQQLSQQIADRRAQLEAALPKLERALQVAQALDRAALDGKIKAAGADWPGALPGSEALDARFPSPQPVQELRVIGADGSQIYPDRHAPVSYALVNIASIHVAYGDGGAPVHRQRAELLFDGDEKSPSAPELEQPLLIDAYRDVAELDELARVADMFHGKTCLALLDNGLQLWPPPQASASVQVQFHRFESEYLAHLSRLEKSGAALAGIIDRPASHSVIELAHLASLPMEQFDEASLSASPFAGMRDAELFAKLLAPGERSALFARGGRHAQRYRQHGQTIYFFYLKTFEPENMLRVEVPAWTAQDADLLRVVHAGVLADSRTLGGYPYALARAHELAWVTPEERQILNESIAFHLGQEGMMPMASRKALAKQWLGARRRHHV